MKPGVYLTPTEIDENVAKTKLQTLGLKIDTLTKEQKLYTETF
jgi:adenosylhomocysteinase